MSRRMIVVHDPLFEELYVSWERYADPGSGCGGWTVHAQRAIRHDSGHRGDNYENLPYSRWMTFFRNNLVPGAVYYGRDDWQITFQERLV